MTASIERRDESSEMQMAMALTGQKPIQRARNGECSEGLPGSKERGMRGEKSQGLGRPWWLLDMGSERGVWAGETDGVPRKGKPGNGSRPDSKLRRTNVHDRWNG